jgi:hypothetical protein
MKKVIVVVAAATVLLASCKTSKSCDAYGRIKITSTTKHITRK